MSRRTIAWEAIWPFAFWSLMGWAAMCVAELLRDAASLIP